MVSGGKVTLVCGGWYWKYQDEQDQPVPFVLESVSVRSANRQTCYLPSLQPSSAEISCNASNFFGSDRSMDKK